MKLKLKSEKKKKKKLRKDNIKGIQKSKKKHAEQDL